MTDRQQQSDIYILPDDQPEDKTLPRFIEWLRDGVIKIPRADSRGGEDDQYYTS